MECVGLSQVVNCLVSAHIGVSVPTLVMVEIGQIVLASLLAGVAMSVLAFVQPVHWVHWRTSSQPHSKMGFQYCT
jgi:hypothetical protein